MEKQTLGPKADFIPNSIKSLPEFRSGMKMFVSQTLWNAAKAEGWDMTDIVVTQRLPVGSRT